MEEFLFEFKKTASIYLNPITIGLEIIIIGLVMIGFSRRKPKKKPKRWWRKLKRVSGDLGIVGVVAGCLFLYLCCISPISDSLLYTLENKHEPLDSENPDLPRKFRENPPRHIVVLAGGARYHERKQPSSQLGPSTTARVLEGAQLHKLFPDTSFIVTGQPNETNGMAALALSLGVPNDRIIQESESRDTKDHPRKLETLIRENDPFLLVTSAVHMPRSLALFQKHGYEPIPAPCDFWVYPKFAAGNPYQSQNFVPKIINLYKTDLAFHEYMGILWAKIRDQTGEPVAETEEEPVPIPGPPKEEKKPTVIEL
ncbi:MAG: DUF218 domain-containing protein [Verrucomicrobiales bacterium]|nr:DUF218 domain-containing protein [Verrucomicrobiales bacterium]